MNWAEGGAPPWGGPAMGVLLQSCWESLHDLHLLVLSCWCCPAGAVLHLS